jgi:hypothetical protein
MEHFHGEYASSNTSNILVIKIIFYVVKNIIIVFEVMSGSLLQTYLLLPVENISVHCVCMSRSVISVNVISLYKFLKHVKVVCSQKRLHGTRVL